MNSITTDYTTKLAFFFREKHSLPFNWQTNNCAFFAADWAAILTGTDPIPEFREMSAKNLVRYMNAHDLAVVIKERCALLGWPLVPLTFARRGDMVQTEIDATPALGVCNGHMSGFPGLTGLVYFPTLKCQRAWRIS